MLDKVLHSGLNQWELLCINMMCTMEWYKHRGKENMAVSNTEWQSQVSTELQIAIQTERCALISL